MPANFRANRQTENLRDLNELVLDEGTRPKAQLQGVDRPPIPRAVQISDESMVAPSAALVSHYVDSNRRGGQPHRYVQYRIYK